ncbi:MAG: helix-turn-helix transcriptional regulator [Cyanobacteria bacterium J06554_3]
MKTATPKAATLSVVPSTSSTSTHRQPSNPIGMLRAVIGNLQDGFILASPTGEIHQRNQPAERICDLLNAKENQLPIELWTLCQSALKNKDVPAFDKLDADIILPNIGTVRIRVQNITIGDTASLLIVLEDRQQTLRNRALSDAALYGLTERETEIWQMRLRGAAYKEISTTLWISVDTVKKHVKSILSKQRSHQDDMEYALMA